MLSYLYARNIVIYQSNLTNYPNLNLNNFLHLSQCFTKTALTLPNTTYPYTTLTLQHFFTYISFNFMSFYIFNLKIRNIYPFLITRVASVTVCTVYNEKQHSHQPRARSETLKKGGRRGTMLQ